MQNNLIVVEQLPVITERLRLVSEKIGEKIAEAKSLVATDKTVKTIKAMRSDLNADFKALEEQRKTVKASILAPYDAFEVVYKQCVSNQYKQADIDLKTEIDRVEGIIKAKKSSEVEAYFEEYAKSRRVDFVGWDQAGIKVGLSDSVKSLKEASKSFVDKVCDDLSLIETLENREEVLVEYHRTLNASQAITTVAARHKAIEDQKAKQAEMEAKRVAEKNVEARVVEVAPPQLEPPEVKQFTPVPFEFVRTLVFKVTAPLSMLRELKEYLDDGGYTYE